MNRASFSVPALDAYRSGIDLGNVLIAMKGVALVEVHLQTHSIDVQYDAGFTRTETLRNAIRDSGYPVDGVTEPVE